MNSALLSLLQANGCDQQIFDPPEEYEVSPNVIEQDEMFSNFDSSLAYSLLNDPDIEEKKDQDNYMSIRHSYTNEIKKKVQVDESEDKLKEFERIAREGNPDELLELFNLKHTWKKAIYEARSKEFNICEDEFCSNTALPGSLYCPNHIHLDQEQKLFVQCPTCHRNHPKMMRCPSCKE